MKVSCSSVGWHHHIWEGNLHETVVDLVEYGCVVEEASSGDLDRFWKACALHNYNLIRNTPISFIFDVASNLLHRHCRYPDYHSVRYGSHQDGGRCVASASVKSIFR